MNDMLLIKSVFIFVIFWGIGIVLLWFRPRIEIFWKIIATLIFCFYVWFFFKEINSGIDSFLAGWYIFSIHFLKEIISLVFVNLFFFWPIALIIVFYRAQALGAERLLKFMSVLTLVLWIVFIIYVFFSKGIDKFLFENMKNIMPR